MDFSRQNTILILIDKWGGRLNVIGVNVRLDFHVEMTRPVATRIPNSGDISVRKPRSIVRFENCRV